MLPITVMAVSGMIEKSVAHNRWITGLGVGIHYLYFEIRTKIAVLLFFCIIRPYCLKQAIHKCILFEIARGKEHDKDYDS